MLESKPDVTDEILNGIQFGVGGTQLGLVELDFFASEVQEVLDTSPILREQVTLGSDFLEEFLLLLGTWS